MKNGERIKELIIAKLLVNNDISKLTKANAD